MKTSPSIQILTHFSQDPGMGGMFFVSFILHLVAVSAMFLLPNLASTRTYYSPVYSVRLVNVQPAPAPASKGGFESGRGAIPVGPAGGSKARPEEKEKADFPGPEGKGGLGEEDRRGDRTAPPAKGRKEGRYRHRSNSTAAGREERRFRHRADPGEKEAAQVSSAIERIRKKVTIGSAGAVETGDPGTGGTSSGFMSIKYKMYYNLIWQRIRNVWVLPERGSPGQERSGDDHRNPDCEGRTDRGHPVREEIREPLPGRIGSPSHQKSQSPSAAAPGI